MSQCKALYKDHSETIMGNMDSIVFLGGREASTLKMCIRDSWMAVCCCLRTRLKS